jgi:VCBS repeat-containing protein
VNSNVSAVNDAPVASDQAISVTANVLFNGQLTAIDPDGASLTYQVVTTAKKGTVVVNASTGAFTYTASANAKGNDSFTFRVTDGTLSSTAKVTVTIR